MISAIKKAKRDPKRDMFGKKHICFGCKSKIRKYSKIVGLQEVGTLGLSYLQVILCDKCAKRILSQIQTILLLKSYRKINAEKSSIYN